MAIDHARDAGQLPEQRVAPLQPTVIAAYTGPSGGLTAVPHRAQPVTSTDPGINYIDSDDDSEEAAPAADGTSLAARLARLHYPRQRLAGNLTLPTWVPRSPPVPYERWYRIRQGDLARCKAQTLPARRCFSDHRLDDEEEMLQTMMTSLCSTNSDSLPNLGGPAAVGARSAASMDELGPSSLEEFGPVSLDDAVGEAVTPTAEPGSGPGSPAGVSGSEGWTVNGAGAVEGSTSPGRAEDCVTPTNTADAHESSPKREPKSRSQSNGPCESARGDGGVGAGEGSSSRLDDGGLGSSCSNVQGTELESPGRTGSFVSWQGGAEADSGCLTGDQSVLAEAEAGGDGGQGGAVAGPQGSGEARQPAVGRSGDGAGGRTGDGCGRTTAPVHSAADPTTGRPLPEREAFCPPGSPTAPAATSTPIRAAAPAAAPAPAAVSTPPGVRRGKPDGDSSSDADSASDQRADDSCSRLPPYHRYTKSGKMCCTHSSRPSPLHAHTSRRDGLGDRSASILPAACPARPGTAAR